MIEKQSGRVLWLCCSIVKIQNPMIGKDHSWGEMAPLPAAAVAPLNMEREEHWRHFDNSVNAVSFGFVATAILISMFLVMAIFERFLRPRSLPSGPQSHSDLEAQLDYNGKLNYPSPKMTVYVKGVSVLMPGEQIPTFIAHPAPIPCPPEGILLPLHQHNQSLNFSSSSITSLNAPSVENN